MKRVLLSYFFIFSGFFISLSGFSMNSTNVESDLLAAVALVKNVKILKRIPCWYGSGFNHDRCAKCEEYALLLIFGPDKIANKNTCPDCHALLYHYEIRFFPLNGNKLGRNDKVILPPQNSEEVSKVIFKDNVVCNFAQVFIEGPDSELIVRNFRVSSDENSDMYKIHPCEAWRVIGLH